MRILHLHLTAPGKGGIERLLVDFFDQLNGTAFRVSMGILAGPSATAQELAERGCGIEYLHRRTDRFDWGLFPKLVRLLRRHRPDVIHMHTPAALLFGVPAARWLGIRALVYTCHASEPTRSALQFALVGGLLRLVPARVAVSATARRLLANHCRVPSASVQIVYNGVDLDRFAPPTDDGASAAPVIGFCGVFRPEKQLPVLIAAFAQMRKQGLPARLLLVGDGPTMPECRARAEQCGVARDVTFAGEQADVRAFLRQMDVFVLPSRNEAMPVALLEAMAMERAVVASNVGGIPEIVTDGATGLLTPAGDETQLSSALMRLVTDASLRRRLGAAARQRVEEHFSLDAMMAQYAAIYRRLAGRIRQRELAAASA